MGKSNSFSGEYTVESKTYKYAKEKFEQALKNGVINKLEDLDIDGEQVYSIGCYGETSNEGKDYSIDVAALFTYHDNTVYLTDLFKINVDKENKKIDMNQPIMTTRFNSFDSWTFFKGIELNEFEESAIMDLVDQMFEG